MSDPITITRDDAADTVTIEGIVYSQDLFRQFGYAMPIETPLKIVSRNGVMDGRGVLHVVQMEPGDPDWKGRGVNRNCGHCHHWAATCRTEAVEWMKAECRKHSPSPANDQFGSPHRAFPVTRGDDGCGDFEHASRKAFREDYAEKLFGPPIAVDAVLIGGGPVE